MASKNRKKSQMDSKNRKWPFLRQMGQDFRKKNATEVLAKKLS